MTHGKIMITFLPARAKIGVIPGTTLLEAAKQAGVRINADCGGTGSCGKCRAKIIDGPVGDATETEKIHLTTEENKQGLCLMCQRRPEQDITVEVVTASAGTGDSGTEKATIISLDLELKPAVIKRFHILEPPTVQNNTADLDRLMQRLPDAADADVRLVGGVPDLFRDAQYRVTSVVYNNLLIAFEKGNTTAENYGIAVDIGTTSVAGYLANLAEGKIVAAASTANRQGMHGADVISRVTYTMEHDGGLSEMQKLAAQTIDEVVGRLLYKSGVARDNVYSMTLIGNTVMSHLLLGVSPVGVASAPFVPAFARSINGTVEALGLKSLPGYTRFTLLPNIAGYVGSDTVGVILATKLDKLPGNWLAVDVGTNGEIVLAAGGRLLTCSTAAGPAFEGARISQGMRAETGAIEEVNINDDVYCKVVGDAEPAGICGSGLVDAVSELVRLEVLEHNGRIKKPEDCPDNLPVKVKERIRPAGRGYKFVLAAGAREVAITQKDISELQLAKGAIRAGIQVLLDEAKIDPVDLEGILLAGAFGSNLRPASIQQIGMFPGIELSRIKAVGNAAGTGAVMALLSRDQLELAKNLPGRVEHIELSVHQGFQQLFIDSLGF
ncbi:ASKHA domain-containing protein [Desulfotruncus alcoholivorax]|uniref:ASKHA domain-containing protein n=1 Tax=Desulfotruncus alcoholivorax TaxID=265477 RepID=UPI00054DEF81|nr:ASKHA domain-containing protein [Desulfotruncus alcoholivorax]